MQGDRRRGRERLRLNLNCIRRYPTVVVHTHMGRDEVGQAKLPRHELHAHTLSLCVCVVHEAKGKGEEERTFFALEDVVAKFARTHPVSLESSRKKGHTRKSGNANTFLLLSLRIFLERKKTFERWSHILRA